MTDKQFIELRLGKTEKAEEADIRQQNYIGGHLLVPQKGHSYCRFRLQTGMKCGKRCIGNHPQRVPDEDHGVWFREEGGTDMVFTIQPYVVFTSTSMARLVERHGDFAAKEGLIVRVSEKDSWWNPGETVLIEYRSNRWWQ